MTSADTRPASIAVRPARLLRGTLVATLATADPRSFETLPVGALAMTLEGIAGDRHAGFTRKAGGREPWYPRGGEMRSGRQITIVSVEELQEIAEALGVSAVEPGWIGANLLCQGVDRLSFLPAGARLFFEGGASVVVEAQNAPCRHAGRAVARHTGRAGDELAFPKAAKRLRGVVASVERAGTATAGSEVGIRLPEQWIY